jgi:hypothetical protein
LELVLGECLLQVRTVDGHEQICLGVLAFGLQSLDESAA